jgi:hypothetical protein
MIDLNKKYKTRSGLDAEVFVTDLHDSHFPVAAVLHYPCGRKLLVRYTIDGKERFRDGSELDLIEVKEKQGFWVNFYPNGYSNAHETKEKADELASDNRIACIYLEFEEGEGL